MITHQNTPHTAPPATLAEANQQLAAMQRTIADLQSQVQSLTGELDSTKDSGHANDAARQQERQRLEELLANVPGIVWEVSTAGPYPQVQFVSDYAEQMLGYPIADWLTKPDFWSSITHPDDEATAREAWETSLREGRATTVQWRWLAQNGRMIWTETQQRPMYDAAGAICGLRGVTMDISARIDAASEQRRLQDEIIRVQEATLAELSTPLIPISADVVVMPLIGAVDSRRAQQVLESLLNGLAEQRARTAIVDITGVPVVDTQVANTLLRAAQAVRRLGAHVVLTGIRPEVAQTLVGLGVELRGIVTHSTLQRGIAFALESSRTA